MRWITDVGHLLAQSGVEATEGTGQPFHHHRAGIGEAHAGPASCLLDCETVV